MEGIQLPRGWRPGIFNFHRKFDALWFAYFEHLGVIADYLLVPVQVQEEHFTPTFFVEKWNAFVYVLPEQSVEEASVLRCREAIRLWKCNESYDVIVAIGRPDEPNTLFLVYSKHVQCETNIWTIAGIVDRYGSIAYYWMMINIDGTGYIGGTKEQFKLCFCRELHCAICARFLPFLPADAYDTTFSIDIGRHLPPDTKLARKPRRRVRHGDPR